MIIIAIVAPATLVEGDVRVRRVHDTTGANLVRTLRFRSHVHGKQIPIEVALKARIAFIFSRCWTDGPPDIVGCIVEGRKERSLCRESAARAVR